jgi:hypothetical protein
MGIITLCAVFSIPRSKNNLEFTTRRDSSAPFVILKWDDQNRSGRCFPFGKHRPLSKEGRYSYFEWRTLLFFDQTKNEEALRLIPRPGGRRGGAETSV